MNPTATERDSQDGPNNEWLEIVRKNVGNLRFGSVQITVHEGRVTQIESIEKTRFVASRDAADKPTR